MSFLNAKTTYRLAMFAIIATFTAPVLAHVDASHAATGLLAGLAHPFSGLDHLLAMLAVGVWAAQSKRAARWVLPLAFPATMALGSAIGMTGYVLQGVEFGIVASVTVLGLLIAIALTLPVWASAMVVSALALLHGFAHGAELPQGASGAMYGIGFVAATFALHLTGLAAGLVAQSPAAARAVRVLGAAMAASGMYLLAAMS